jgi:hypothetical protein
VPALQFSSTILFAGESQGAACVLAPSPSSANREDARTVERVRTQVEDMALSGEAGIRALR